VRGNFQARFLGGLGMATSPGYPTLLIAIFILVFEKNLQTGIIKT
jgi:hypothetical protein